MIFLTFIGFIMKGLKEKEDFDETFLIIILAIIGVSLGIMFICFVIFKLVFGEKVKLVSIDRRERK